VLRRSGSDTIAVRSVRGGRLGSVIFIILMRSWRSSFSIFFLTKGCERITQFPPFPSFVEKYSNFGHNYFITSNYV